MPRASGGRPKKSSAHLQATKSGWALLPVWRTVRAFYAVRKTSPKKIANEVMKPDTETEADPMQQIRLNLRASQKKRFMRAKGDKPLEKFILDAAEKEAMACETEPEQPTKVTII
jgi:hypothetical protein